MTRSREAHRLQPHHGGPPAATAGAPGGAGRAPDPCPNQPTTGDAPLLYTAQQAAELLQVKPSWLHRKAAARVIPCRLVGKHLRFSRTDLDAIAARAAQPTHSRRGR